MALEKSNPLEELKEIDRAIDQANDLDTLRPIFYRLEEIASQNADAVEVQVAVGDIKQHILNRGSHLKERKQSAPPQPGGTVAPPSPTPPENDSAVGEKTMILPVPWVSASQHDRVTHTSSPGTSSPGVPIRPGQEAVPPGPPPAQPDRGVNRKGAGWTKVIGTIVVLAVIAILAIAVGKRIPAKPSQTAVRIDTVPPGASIAVNGEAKCTSACTLSLPAGTYQVGATLAGYEPGAGNVTVVAGQPGDLSLSLQPQPQTLRIHSDLVRGAVKLDDQMPAVLHDHEYTFEDVKPGRHTVKVTGPGGDTSFSFELAPAKLPQVMGTVTAHDVLTVLVASFGKGARVVTSSGPWKLTVNGQKQSETGPAGVDIDSFNPGENELVTGEGNYRRAMKEQFNSAPALTVFVTTDPNAGSLIVSTGEDDVRVFLNDREYPLRTQHGELRIQTAGPVAVRVSKEGFQDPPAQVAEVKKGSQANLQFKMLPLPAAPPR